MKKIIRESLLIVFSILFALVINEWRANQKLRVEKEKILDSIVLELENNLASLEEVAPYHAQVAERLNELLTQEYLEDSLGNQNPIEVFLQHSGYGLQEPRVQANAWQTAQLSGTLSQFDNETIYELSKLYELQNEGVEAAWKKIVEMFYDNDSFEAIHRMAVLQKLQLSMASLSGMEEYLIEKHQKTLDFLNKGY
ncbi:MAG: hypothetical protein AAF433_13590 [Bacteroidota bacterium]